MSYHTCVYYLLGLSVLLSACGGQKELIQMMSKTQAELSECRIELGQHLNQTHQNKQELQDELTQLKNQLDEREGKLKIALEQVESAKKEGIVVHEVSRRQLALLASSVGAEVSLRDQVRIIAKFGELKSFFVYSKKNHVLMAHARFAGFALGFKAVNEWNRTRRFSRVYLDKDQDIVIEAEIDLEPGVRPKVLQSWIKNFGLVLNLFHYTLRQGTLRGNQEKGTGGAERERI